MDAVNGQPGDGTGGLIVSKLCVCFYEQLIFCLFNVCHFLRIVFSAALELFVVFAFSGRKFLHIIISIVQLMYIRTEVVIIL